MSEIDLEDESWNPNICQLVKHKDKIEWIKQIYLRECMKQTPGMEYCKDPSYFEMYDQGWDITRSGWNVTWKMFSKYPENWTTTEIINDLDRRLGFVNVTRKYTMGGVEYQKAEEKLNNLQ